jgi:hypothetical protein
MDKMMTSSERFLKNDKLCVSIEILLAKHTYTYIHNARNEDLYLRKKENTILVIEFYRFENNGLSVLRALFKINRKS